MKKAIYLILITAIISGLANFFNKFAMSAIGKDAFQYTTLKNGLTALVLSLFIFTPLVWSKLRLLTKKDWSKLVLIGLLGGGIPFLLFFKGLSLTSAVNASLIHKTLFIWVAILAWPTLKEKMTKLQILALGLLVVGTYAFGGFKNFSWGYAESLILLATLFWAVETVIAKRILATINPLVLGWARMAFGSIVLVGFLFLTGDTAGLLTFSSNQFGWLLLVSVLLTGYIICWYAALKKLPATVVTCFLVLATPITTMLNSIFVTKQLDSSTIFSAVIILVAAGIIWWSREALLIRHCEERSDEAI